MAARKLFVFAHLDGDWVPAGRLTLYETGTSLDASEFAYGTRYLARPNALEVDPLSLSLEDPGSLRNVVLSPQTGLVSFGGIRDAAPDAWGRRVIEAKLKAPANSLAESTYLLEAGSNRVGALDVRSTLEEPPRTGIGDWHDLQHLVEAAERIELGLPIPAHLDPIFAAGTSLGGARPKASVRDEQGVQWLAKFPSSSDAIGVPDIEVGTLRLAAACGLTAPPVKIQVVGNRRIMLIRRFDRYWAAAGQHIAASDWAKTMRSAGLTEMRAGFVSALTMLGGHETESNTKAYADLGWAIRNYCHRDVIRDDNRELFARMVFNIFVSNDDDHLRNHGFVRDPQLPGWRLSPLYDVMPRPSHAHERVLHLGVGSQGRTATLDNAMTEHEAFNMSKREALATIAGLWSVVREWKVRFEEYRVPLVEIERVAPAMRHIDDVAGPELRRQLP